jgi:hypothetical protein
MPQPLTKKEKAQCKVILALLVTSLLIQRVGSKVLDENTEQDLPAVVECTNMIDEILRDMEPARRDLAIQKIQTHRIRLTKKVAKFEVSACLVGALQYIASGKIKTKPGTRLDFIVQTFSKNLEVMQKTVPEHSQTANEFQQELAKAINAI